MRKAYNKILKKDIRKDICKNRTGNVRFYKRDVSIDHYFFLSKVWLRSAASLHLHRKKQREGNGVVPFFIFWL